MVCQTSFAQRSRNEVCEWGGWARAAALVEGVGGRPSPRIPLGKAVKRFVSGRWLTNGSVGPPRGPPTWVAGAGFEKLGVPEGGARARGIGN